MKTNLDGAAKDLSAAGAQMKTLSEKLRGAIDSGDLAQVQKIIGDDPQRLAQALTTPAVVERHPIYAVENFGSSMAPLYATVAMWMGTMLIGVVCAHSRFLMCLNYGLRKYFLGVGVFLPQLVWRKRL